MAVYTAKLSSKGQITLPVEVRRAFALKEGDSIDFYVDGGKMRMRARNLPMSAIFGCLKGDGAPMSVEQMDESIAQAVTEDDERIKREWAAASPKVAE